MKNENGYPCPCCGYLTRSEDLAGTYEICPICFWEDDNVQFEDPTFKGGANEMSLIEARENFLKFGAISQEFKKCVRSPLPQEMPGPNSKRGSQ
ncbi:MAG: CPCC family cysteine-rich protein [Bdellovibrionia bacterium]